MAADQAPLILFTYNRPDHLGRTLAALKRNELATETMLYVFSDGAKSDADKRLVDEVRQQLTGISGFQSVKIVEREKNCGLAASIITGVTSVLEKHGCVIVLEDDIVTSPYFLRYMNEALKYYADVPEVACVSGYIYPINAALPSAFFLRGADCWGWATWRRGWDLFNPDGRALLAQLIKRKLEFDFDFEGGAKYTEMLRAQVEGRNDSWAVRWYASAFLAGKLTLYPGQSLVQNIGNDGSGRHAIPTGRYAVELRAGRTAVGVGVAKEDVRARREFARYFWGGKRGGRVLARLPWLWPALRILRK